MFRQRSTQIGRATAIAAVSLTLAFTAGCSRDPNVKKQKFLESGKRFEASGKHKEAAIQFLNALKVDKNFADAHYELANTYLKMGSAMGAYTELSKAVALSPSNLTARIELGDLLLSGGAPIDRVEAQASAAMALDSNNADVYALLAGIAQKKGDNAEAMKDIQRAIAIDPNRAAFHIAVAQMQAANPANAGTVESELRKAISLDAKNPMPHLVLAAQLEKKGDLPDAEKEYTLAVAAAPNNLQSRAALAGLYLREGNKDKTEQTLHQAVDDMPDSEEASGLLLDYYMHGGQLDRAETVLSELRSKHPKSFAIKITYARLLADKKDFDKAAVVIKELTKSDGGNPQVQMLNAMLLINTGKIDDAFALLQKGVKDSPNNIQMQLLLARVAAVKGDLATSESSFRAVVKQSPANMDGESGLADIALGHKDAGALSEVADRTIRIHPDLAQGYMWRGIAEASRKEYDKAEADFQLVLKGNPNNPTAYLELGMLRLAQGRTAEGKALLEKALDKDPNQLRALTTLVAYDFQAKQPAKALSRVQADIARSPGNANLYDVMASVQLQSRDFQGALESSRKAMQMSPSSPGPVQTFAQAEIALGQIDPAITTWQQWMTTHPKDSRALVLLGVLEQSKGDEGQAADYYKKALQADPTNAGAANNLAYLMVENGQNVDVALSYAQTARRAMPDSPQTEDTLAWVYYYKGDYSSARDLLEDAVKTTPDDASVQFHLGMTYSKMNDKTSAELHLKKALVLAPNGKTGKDAAAALAKLG